MITTNKGTFLALAAALPLATACSANVDAPGAEATQETASALTSHNPCLGGVCQIACGGLNQSPCGFQCNQGLVTAYQYEEVSGGTWRYVPSLCVAPSSVTPTINTQAILDYSNGKVWLSVNAYFSTSGKSVPFNVIVNNPAEMGKKFGPYDSSSGFMAFIGYEAVVCSPVEVLILSLEGDILGRTTISAPPGDLPPNEINHGLCCIVQGQAEPCSFDVGGGSSGSSCAGRGQTGHCCDGLGPGPSGACEPCGGVGSPAQPCCTNGAPCDSLGVCVADPTANGYRYCAPKNQIGLTCPGGGAPQAYNCQVDGCPYSPGNLGQIYACSQAEAEAAERYANQQCTDISCN
jgi:hypothetical protein